VPFDNSWDDRQMVGIAIGPYNIDWGQVNNIFHIIGVRNEFKKLDTVVNIARILYDVILKFEQIFHLDLKLILQLHKIFLTHFGIHEIRNHLDVLFLEKKQPA
jgi:hypothetical protein